MVQNVFFRIWRERAGWISKTSVTAYLYQSVYHESLNWLKHKKVKAAYQSHAAHQAKSESDNALT